MYYRNDAFDKGFADDYSFYCALAGPEFTVGTSVSSSRMLGAKVRRMVLFCGTVLSLIPVKFVLPPPRAGKTAVIDLKTKPTIAHPRRLSIDSRDGY